ncbi:hypothetical protein [Breoghania sp.]|uniref:hypothetical protein n=1 Tax=Breoghania sp. TaxID=2065378 RepID=UPI0026262C0D|nr:hypothetical protein [Breoghania sp.]MDJ0930928.1 hypothetical protein [Breoghania sp.]
MLEAQFLDDFSARNSGGVCTGDPLLAHVLDTLVADDRGQFLFGELDDLNALFRPSGADFGNDLVEFVEIGLGVVLAELIDDGARLIVH